MSDPVTYTAVLPVAEETVLFVSRLLATDNAIGRSTAYRYLHEGIDALGGLADQRPREVTLDARR